MKKQPDTGQFSDLGISENFLKILTKKGFTKPTPIQHQVIPGALERKDVIGIAQTGTGKTLAFGIPMIQNIAQTKGHGLILVPTRELALQVESSLMTIAEPLGFRSAVVIGGESQNKQVKALKRNPHIVIATPGRLDDLMKQGLYKLDKLTIFTLDEADRMLDDGFLPQIKRMMQAAPKDRQTLLFSATMPKSISELASKFMKIPLRIEIAPQGTSAKNVEQELFLISKQNKMRLLDSLLEQYKEDTVLVFSRTKHGAKKIARDIRNMGHTATEIHSNRTQNQRKAALEGFTKGKFRVMVATDIAARGIDVSTISLVINYDLPENSEDYVHRIGRTGRAGRYGKAISFMTASQKSNIKKIERLISKTLPILDLPSLPAPRPKPPRTNSGGAGQGRRPSGSRGYRSGGGRSRRSSDSGGSKPRRSSYGRGRKQTEKPRGKRTDKPKRDNFGETQENGPQKTRRKRGSSVKQKRRQRKQDQVREISEGLSGLKKRSERSKNFKKKNRSSKGGGLKTKPGKKRYIAKSEGKKKTPGFRKRK